MRSLITTTCALMCIGSGALAVAADIPTHPADISFEELNFTPPSPSDFRNELSNGVPVFMASSDEFPLVTITLSFKGGAYMEPDGMAGLAAMTGAMIRTGGSSMMSPSDMDEEFDFMAANVSAGIGDRNANATINCLTSNLDDAFGLFMDMVQQPRFDSDRLEVLRGQQLEQIKTRDDDGLQIALREMNFLMWGEDFFEARQPTKSSLESISVDDMRAFHASIFNPANMMVSVTGDFDESTMLSFLEKSFQGWESGARSPEIPSPTHTFTPGVYYYEKDQPQVQVLIGHRGVQRDDPNAPAVEVMNDILGGSGFTSRITNSVRTREGLAYTAGSVMRSRVEYPGMFMSYFFTKVPTTALATRLVFDEIDTIQNEAATTDEVETIQNNIIETFPRTFESKGATMGLFMSDERTNRPAGYWENYRERVRSVNSQDVQQAANDYLHPEDAVILIVGPWEEIKKGNSESEADEARIATMEEFFGGKATQIPTRDPETLKPVESQD
ncbi:MAG: pitrilysin family protein [Phycisphaerales bacterium]|nr:pitrilysin family protein [Phycisphaerales bacterium]